MKSLIAIAVMLFSVNSQAHMTFCSDTDKDGNTASISLDSMNTNGAVTMTDQKGTETASYSLHIYIMNDNSPGYYYYEGLAYAPGDTTGPKFFRMKMSQDDTMAKLVISHVGGKAIHTMNMSACSMKKTTSALSR